MSVDKWRMREDLSGVLDPALKAYRSRRARAELLRGALQLLDEEGPDGLTLRKLATRLGRGPTWLYGEFADREALMLSVADEVVGELVRSCEGAIPEAREGGGRLRSLHEEFLRWAQRRPSQFTLAAERPQCFEPWRREVERALLLAAADGSGAARGRTSAQRLASASLHVAIAWAGARIRERRAEPGARGGWLDEALEVWLTGVLGGVR